MSNDPAVQAITGGKPVQFTAGRPDFTPWSLMSVNVPHGTLLGTMQDGRIAQRALAQSGAVPGAATASDVRNYLRANRLAVHHASDTCLQIVPRKLNDLVSHVGAAADLRLQNDGDVR